MRKKIYFRWVLLLSVMAFTTSCSEMIFRTMFHKSYVERRFVMQKENKEIIYIPMVHLGSEAFYTEVKDFITRKRNEGYTIYHEGVTLPEGISEEEIEVLDRKQRKIVGFHLTEYNDGNNKTLPKWVKKYTAQTNENTGVLPTDKVADLDQKSLIKQFEEKYGTIILTDCDLNTPLTSEYKCSKEHPQSRYYTHTLRDYHLLKTLINAPENKIILLYGSLHQRYLGENLENNGYKLTFGTYKKM